MFQLLFSYRHGVAENQTQPRPPAEEPPPAPHREQSSSSSFRDPVFPTSFYFFSASYGAITIQCMPRDKAKRQLPPSLWLEGKGAVTSLQIFLHHLSWKHSAEGDGSRTSHNTRRTNKSVSLLFILPDAVMLLSHVFYNTEPRLSVLCS